MAISNKHLQKTLDMIKHYSEIKNAPALSDEELLDMVQVGKIAEAIGKAFDDRPLAYVGRQTWESAQGIIEARKARNR